MKRGLFITIEGTDGSGKTTQMGLIRDYVRSAGCEVVMVREPGGTRISERIRNVILDPEYTEMSANAEMLLYAASRAQLVAETVRPALEQGKIVICDRFIDSTYAYQGFGRGIELGVLESVNNIAVDGIIPDITFFFDLDPELALGRRIASTATDRIENEKMEFHRKVHNGYVQLALKYPDRIRRIDSSRSVEAIWDEVRQVLGDIIG
ncbi:MAG: dTMP kinase [Clostridiales bacterium GWC2_40_7]|nr:MAG: dTMP kinase [Clostridiales bacterium GWC2_40_7]